MVTQPSIVNWSGWSLPGKGTRDDGLYVASRKLGELVGAGAALDPISVLTLSSCLTRRRSHSGFSIASRSNPKLANDDDSAQLSVITTRRSRGSAVRIARHRAIS